jgi:deazaflavin-dependent oxidoreductase (nitroreductase family)
MDWTPLNPLFSWLLRSPLHWLVSPGVTLLTVTGRKSGRRYTIPVGYQRDGDRIVIMVSNAPAKQWWRNYRQPGPVELLLRGRAAHGEAEVLAPDSAEFRTRAEATFRRLPFLGRQFGLVYDRRVGLTAEQLAHLGATAAVVRVTLATPVGAGPDGTDSGA